MASTAAEPITVSDERGLNLRAPVPVRTVLRPGSIAIVGASPKPGAAGANVLASLRAFGYAGEIHLVSRGRTEVLGEPCVGSVQELPRDIDLAVLGLPGPAVVDAFQACAEQGMKAAIIYASGFAEQDEEGRRAQAEIVRIATEYGMAVVGPNCAGPNNYVDGIPLDGFGVHTPSAGVRPPVLGVVSQSGGMGTVLEWGMRELYGIGATVSVATGNEAVCSAEDFVSDLVDDQVTQVIAVFAETLRKPAVFLDAARRARRAGKPIVLFHPGRSEGARRSARSHTGALVGDHAIMRALVESEGVLLCESREEWHTLVALLCHYPTPPASSGVGIITCSGAFRGYAFDLAERHGFEIPKFASQTRDEVASTIPEFGVAENPVDLTTRPIVERDLFGKAAAPVMRDPNVGVTLIVAVGTPELTLENARQALPYLVAGEAPVVYTLLTDSRVDPPELAPMFIEAGIPYLGSPEEAIPAVARLMGLRARLDAAEDRHVIDEPPPELTRRGQLTEVESKAFIAKAGIPVPRGGLARDLTEARAIAAKIGYPVVLKAQASALSHKSDAGAVLLNLGDEPALEAGWASLAQNVRQAAPEVELDGVLVEAMADGGVEMIVGAKRDSDWGPVVVVGLGGIWTELLGDVRVLPCDLSANGILREVERLQAAGVLHGARGGQPIDMVALADAVARVGWLMRSTPHITELDINPLVVYPEGRGAVALDALIVTEASA